MDTSDECSTSKIIPSNNDNENLQFSLSAIIQAHSDDAKCVVETPTGTLISGGRDGFMKIWTNEGINWTNTSTVQQKDCLAINSIALGSAPDAGFESLIFLGRKNGSVAIYNASNTEEPVKVLQGHKSNVCALYFDDKTGFLMSGSWDHNAVVWPLELLLKEGPDRVPIGFLSGHKCSVWAVATVPSKLPKFLTGSADKSIKLWSKDYDAEEVSALSPSATINSPAGGSKKVSKNSWKKLDIEVDYNTAREVLTKRREMRREFERQGNENVVVVEGGGGGKNEEKNNREDVQKSPPTNNSAQNNNNNEQSQDQSYCLVG
uniref:Uncharacterized protein n=1 Tax=Meloidogyne javanica TaxID=6303 RepID=A0A915MJ59_MELJA